MADNLNYSESLKRNSFFSLRQRAWHDKGIVLDKVPTAEEAIKLAGLDYEVGKKPSSIEFNGIQKVIPKSYGTYRKDNGQPFGTVGSSYEVIQNKAAFSFFDHIVAKGEAQYETAGCLNNGEVVFISVKLPSYITVQGKDVSEKYLFLVNTHDGSGALTAAFTPIRIVCNNTLNAALKNMQMKISIRHTVNYEKNMEEAPKIMGIANNLSIELEQIYNRMARKTLVDRDLKDMIIRSLASPEALNKIALGEEFSTQLKNQVEKVLEYVDTADSQQMTTTRGTVWGAYNAITGYYQNVKDWKGKDTQFDSIFFGNGALTSQKIFDLCMDKIK